MTDKDRHKIADIARHIMGRTSALRAVRTVEAIDGSKVRELCAEIYCRLDSILEVVEKSEKRGMK